MNVHITLNLQQHLKAALYYRALLDDGRSFLSLKNNHKLLNVLQVGLCLQTAFLSLTAIN